MQIHTKILKNFEFFMLIRFSDFGHKSEFSEIMNAGDWITDSQWCYISRITDLWTVENLYFQQIRNIPYVEKYVLRCGEE